MDIDVYIKNENSVEYHQNIKINTYFFNWLAGVFRINLIDLLFQLHDFLCMNENISSLALKRDIVYCRLESYQEIIDGTYDKKC